jgi:hypothetical protein
MSIIIIIEVHGFWIIDATNMCPLLPHIFIGGAFMNMVLNWQINQEN